MLLLEKKGETFGTMSYNPIQNPFNITNIFDKKLFYSQIGKGNYEEDNHNFEFKKYGNFNNYENYIINNKEKEEMIREIMKNCAGTLDQITVPPDSNEFLADKTTFCDTMIKRIGSNLKEILIADR